MKILYLTLTRFLNITMRIIVRILRFANARCRYSVFTYTRMLLHSRLAKKWMCPRTVWIPWPTDDSWVTFYWSCSFFPFTMKLVYTFILALQRYCIYKFAIHICAYPACTYILLDVETYVYLAITCANNVIYTYIYSNFLDFDKLLIFRIKLITY